MSNHMTLDPKSLIAEARALADKTDLPIDDWNARELDIDHLDTYLTGGDWNFIARSRTLVVELADALEAAMRERDEARAALRAAGEAFSAYEGAIESAQRAYHDYTEWGPSEIGPIDAARNAFGDAFAALGENGGDGR